MIWRIFLLIWCFFILSQGPICAYTAWKMWCERGRFRIAHYTGMMMTALTTTTSLAAYQFGRLLIVGGPRLVPGTNTVVYVRGLEIFGNLSAFTYVVLAAQAFLSMTLWMKGLYFLGVLNGVRKGDL